MVKDTALSFMQKYRGLVGVRSKVPIKDRATLSLVYTPGVGRPCLEIAKDKFDSFKYTCRGNTIAIISDGSSVYGLGDVGPYAAIPMLESRSIFYKTFAGIDAVPIALMTKDLDEIVDTIRYLSTSFGGFHLEDIASPRDFALTARLRRSISLPIHAGDQQSTAISVLAGFINAVKLTEKDLNNIKVVINGAGSGGIATAYALLQYGVKNIIVCDSRGALYYNRLNGMNWVKSELSRYTNPEGIQGKLEDVIKGADVLIGLSVKNCVTMDMVKSMNQDPIIFALALPDPEITYDAAIEAGARVVFTGRSDVPNQVSANTVSPGLMRAALDLRTSIINDRMILSAGEAMAALLEESLLSPKNLIPKMLDFRVAPRIARAVAEAAIETGVNQLYVDPKKVEQQTLDYIYEGKSSWVKPEEHSQSNYFDMTLEEKSLDLHERFQGVIEVCPKIPIKDQYIHDLIYTQPSATEPCTVIQQDFSKVYDITCKNNLVAIVSDGSAVLGYGNLGPHAAMPVMEGKAVLFKTFGGVEAFPICLRTQDVEEIIQTVKIISPSFGGINLEDISSPRCFEVEKRLKEALDIPIFHDDQHGTAVVVLAALINASKIVDTRIEDLAIVINGAGASSIAVTRLLLQAGAKNIIICDTQGAIYQGRTHGMNKYKEMMAEVTNLGCRSGSLEEVIRGADMFIGLSTKDVLVPDMVRSMASDPIVFALANPIPEIMPNLAKEAGAKVVATGRSDFPNQVNNSLAFPGIFRGTLDVRARDINDQMKIAASYAIAGLVDQNSLRPDYIIPDPLDFSVPPAVAEAVARVAMETGVARITVDPEKVNENAKKYLYEGFLQNIS